MSANSSKLDKNGKPSKSIDGASSSKSLVDSEPTVDSADDLADEAATKSKGPGKRKAILLSLEDIASKKSKTGLYF